ncbi:MAG TPA: hypothetical protein PK289_13015 [Bacteroidia bacterium]|jgi:Mg2+/citrate symporter|nr:hypothetical protein [Bacteroidia bacterium]HRG51495.1 hypothetical protein [Bacteroidia bacterium]
MKRKATVLILLFLVYTVYGYAQGCSVCRQAAADDGANGGISKGLNSGILYLMTIPYLVIMTGAYFFFKKPIDAKIKNWKLKHFPAK